MIYSVPLRSFIFPGTSLLLPPLKHLELPEKSHVIHPLATGTRLQTIPHTTHTRQALIGKMSTKESLASVTADAAADLPGPSGAEDTLVVDGGTRLRIATRDLVVTGEDPGRGGGRGSGEDEALTGAGPVAKRRRTCGLFPTGSSGTSLPIILPPLSPSPTWPLRGSPPQDFQTSRH